MENSVKKEQSFGKIIVESVKPHAYKDDVLSAQLRQIVKRKSIYPGKNTGNDKQDALFSAPDFGGEPTVYETEQARVCWIDVPLGTTAAQVQAKIDALGDAARIYQIVSTDIMECLTSGHRYQIEQGNLTLDQMKDKFNILDKETGEIATNEAGETLYRALYFSASGQEDLNHNSTSESIEAEESADSGEVA